ncbi:hypothetical protein [Ralstonia sp. ASV6]|uniref:hypothetical protein n=1 Tax=Ralstonia sp. ASV6 TaxID=2795124 RepID=UPI0018EDAB3F|nr:hypothetical protein [Ralstonia sp. ASV6]
MRFTTEATTIGGVEQAPKTDPRVAADFVRQHVNAGWSEDGAKSRYELWAADLIEMNPEMNLATVNRFAWLLEPEDRLEATQAACSQRVGEHRFTAGRLYPISSVAPHQCPAAVVVLDDSGREATIGPDSLLWFKRVTGDEFKAYCTEVERQLRIQRGAGTIDFRFAGGGEKPGEYRRHWYQTESGESFFIQTVRDVSQTWTFSVALGGPNEVVACPTPEAALSVLLTKYWPVAA